MLTARTFCAPPRLGAVESSAPKLSQKQLLALISNARTPEDDQKLADHYHQQAKAFAQKSKEHTEMPERWPVLGMPKQPGFAPGPCRYFAELYAREAQDAEAMASHHEDMAKAAADSPTKAPSFQAPTPQPSSGLLVALDNVPIVEIGSATVASIRATT